MRRARPALSIPQITNLQAAACLGSIAAGILLFLLGRASVSLSSRTAPQDLSQWTATFREPDTLVVYAYANRDWEYPRNLAFFVRHGEVLGAQSSSTQVADSSKFKKLVRGGSSQ